jgi:hypothetical protein
MVDPMAPPLSPAAQAVLDATMLGRRYHSSLAAALRAVAKFPVDVPPHIRDCAYWPYRNGMDRMREHILAIANELDPQP